MIGTRVLDPRGLSFLAARLLNTVLNCQELVEKRCKLVVEEIDDRAGYSQTAGIIRCRLMSWFRAIKDLVRVLVALFVIAQFAGVVASPLASAEAFAKAAASRAHDHHAHLHDHDGKAVHHHSDGQLDRCCALHAFFAGVLPPVIELPAAVVQGQRFALNLADIAHGVAIGRLDRPPRPLALT
jgi:hypothetical protein